MSQEWKELYEKVFSLQGDIQYWLKCDHDLFYVINEPYDDYINFKLCTGEELGIHYENLKDLYIIAMQWKKNKELVMN